MRAPWNSSPWLYAMRIYCVARLNFFPQCRWNSAAVLGQFLRHYQSMQPPHIRADPASYLLTMPRSHYQVAIISDVTQITDFSNQQLLAWLFYQANVYFRAEAYNEHNLTIVVKWWIALRETLLICWLYLLLTRQFRNYCRPPACILNIRHISTRIKTGQANAHSIWAPASKSATLPIPL